jgi:hypothetical protein
MVETLDQTKGVFEQGERAEPAERWRVGPAALEVDRFLQGPQERHHELRQAILVFFEMIHGFRSLHFVGPCVTVFGSARFEEGHSYYAMAREVGAHLARAGFTVMTGGGPGIMEPRRHWTCPSSGTLCGQSPRQSAASRKRDPDDGLAE